MLLLELLFFFDLLPLLEFSDLVFEELLPEDFADEVLDFLVDLPLPELLLFKEFEVLSEESLPDSIFDVDFFLFFFELEVDFVVFSASLSVFFCVAVTEQVVKSLPDLLSLPHDASINTLTTIEAKSTMDFLRIIIALAFPPTNSR